MLDAYTMINHLQELYGEQSRMARYEISKALFRAKMIGWGNIGEYVLKMISLIEKLKDLEVELNVDLQIDLILQFLLNSFGGFISNFYMNKIDCTPKELLNMLNMAQKKIWN